MVEKRRATDSTRLYRWIAGVLLGIVLTLTGVTVGSFMSDTKAKIETGQTALAIKVEDHEKRLNINEANFRNMQELLKDTADTAKRTERVTIEMATKLDEHMKMGRK